MTVHVRVLTSCCLYSSTASGEKNKYNYVYIYIYSSKLVKKLDQIPFLLKNVVASS